MSGPSLSIHAPPRWLFKFPPDPEPPALPPPSDQSTFKAPFAIPADVYNNVLHFAWPATIASVYAATVFTINAYNRAHGNKPWRISKTKAFRAFVIFHNVFLAIYSGVTCVAMVRALKHSLPNFREEHALVKTVDALCKIQGPRGLGNAITYNSTTSLWGVKNRLINLGLNGSPDPTDVGRIWNEGLAFWGWWFYLSKFYEVLDTLIILAKGKRSTTLQTYHHAGAMLCMWAGIRYMSPPIWMFALVNSGIHTMMYTYYTLSALRVRVPNAIKRSLTSLQILQFIVGASFAAIHLFVSYTVPVSVAHLVPESVASAASAASETATSALSEVSLAAATATAGALLKKLLYRAAGEEGLAENVLKEAAPAHHHPLAQKIFHHEPKQNYAYRTQYEKVPCIDTTGQSFAVWLNLIYLFPLTALFVRFFVKSYLRRTSASAKHPTRRRSMSKSTSDAAHGVQREIESLGKAVEDSEIKVAKKGKKELKDLKDGKAGQALKDASHSVEERKKKVVDDFNRKVSKSLDQANLNGQATLNSAKGLAKDIMRSASQSPRRGRKEDDTKKEKEQEKTRERKKDREPEKKEKSEQSAKVGNSQSPSADQNSYYNIKESDLPEEKGGDQKENQSDIKQGKKHDAKDGGPDVKVEHDEQEEQVLEESKIEPLEDQKAGAQADGDVKQEDEHADGAPTGLSTTDPKSSGVSYADELKK